MNKQEYLERLEACLKHKLSRDEIEDIMRDYAEYFEEGRRQSKQDSEISAKLGDPELVAQQLIEESQEQKNEYHSSSKSTEKKMPWNYAAEGLHRLKDKFQEWDKGEGKRREESNSQEENFCQEESFQDEQEEIREKENHKKCRQSTSDSLLIRGFKAIGRGCRWCIYAAMAFMMLTIAFMISMGLVGFAAMVLGGLATAIVFVVIGVLIGLAGIVASGFGFAFFNFWTGIAVLSGSVALLGFCALLELFLLKMLKIFWSFSKNVFAKSAELWMRMLRKIESWLIVKKEKTAEKSTINKSEKTVSQKENSVPVLPLPMDDAEQQDSKEDSLDGGKEVL